MAKSVQLRLVEDPQATVERKNWSSLGAKLQREEVSETRARVQLCRFPNFGLYVYRSDHLYWAIRCGSIGQNGNGGHAHNDNLSFVFNLKGRDFFVDGGSYLYTPLPSVRNAFRSTRAHTTLALPGQEQNAWNEGLTGLFSMKDQAKARVVSYGLKHFEGEHDGFEITHHRRFDWEGDSLVIEDLLETDSVSELNFNLAPEVEISLAEKSGSDEFIVAMKNGEISLKLFLVGFSGVECKDGFFSPGYGKKMNTQRLIGYRSEPRTRVKIFPEWGEECVTE